MTDTDVELEEARAAVLARMINSVCTSDGGRKGALRRDEDALRRFERAVLLWTLNHAAEVDYGVWGPVTW